MLILASLGAGISGGLLRAGVGMPWTGSRWLAAAAADHAFLMISAFMGSVIPERSYWLDHARPLSGCIAVVRTIGLLAFFGLLTSQLHGHAAESTSRSVHMTSSAETARKLPFTAPAQE